MAIGCRFRNSEAAWALFSLIRSGAADEAREAHRLNRERGGNEILEAFARFSLHVVA